jgi:Uma2 family endonuclease
MSTIAMPPPVVQQQPGQFTPEDLLLSEDEGLYELVEGHLVEKPMGFFSGEVAANITIEIGLFLRGNPLGTLSSEATYRCFPKKPLQIRRPDLSFVLAARRAGVPDDGHVAIRPDLAIEVISPTDVVYNLDEKLLDYASAGIPLTWVFNPAARIVRVHRPDGTSRTFGEDDTLDGGDVLPGFAVVVRDLLPKAAASVKPGS